MSVSDIQQHQQNRLIKAEQLADVLAVAGCDADTAETMPAGCWSLATALVAERRGCDVDPPSSATQALVVSLLRQREDRSDPFASFERDKSGR